MDNLATAYWTMKRLDKSVPLFEEVLTLQEKKLGRDHPDTQHDGGQPRGQLQGRRPAQGGDPTPRGSPSSGEDDSRRFAGSAAHCSTPMRRRARTPSSPTCSRSNWPRLGRSLPKDSPELAGMLAQIGLSLLQQKKWTEAEPLLRECLAIREKTQPDVWSTFNTQSLLGGALLGQKKYAEAEPLLADGLRGDEAAGEDDPAAGPAPASPKPSTG